MAMAVSEVVWVVRLFAELQIRVKAPVYVYSDSKPAIQIADKPVFHERTKHIEVDCHFVRNKHLKKLINLQYISSSNQLADVLTKALGRQQHEYLCTKLGLLDLFQPASLRGSVEEAAERHVKKATRNEKQSTCEYEKNRRGFPPKSFSLVFCRRRLQIWIYSGA